MPSKEPDRQDRHKHWADIQYHCEGVGLPGPHTQQYCLAGKYHQNINNTKTTFY